MEKIKTEISMDQHPVHAEYLPKFNNTNIRFFLATPHVLCTSDIETFDLSVILCRRIIRRLLFV